MLRQQNSKKYALTQFLSKISIFNYLGFVIATYLLLVLLCAAVYYFGEFLRHSANTAMPVASFWECLYFSTITQTTIGYGDIVPTGFGRLIVSFQAVAGTFFIAISIGLYLLKYVWTFDVVRVSSVIAFSPEEKAFRIRIINLNAFDLQNIKPRLWENFKIPTNDFVSNTQIKLCYETILIIGSMASWRIKTLKIEPERINSIFERVKKFYFQIDGKYMYANYISTFEIGREQIYCGNFAPFKKGLSRKDYKKYSWQDFDRIVPAVQSFEKCSECEFSKSCICINKGQP